MSDPVEVSVVLPAYNEEDTIEHTVRVTLDALGEFLPAGAFEVVVAEDGCEDATPEIAAALAGGDDRVRHFHSEDRLGRGGALNAAFRAADGDTLVYFDTDLATDMRHLEELVESVRTGEAEFATGSRWMPDRVVDRPAKRGVPSRGFNAIVRALLGSDVRDHQCGFKAFERAALLDVLEDVEDEHWFWDTEVLTRAQRAGYRVKEFPVDWTPKGDSKVDLVRDVFGMGSQVLRCFWEFEVAPRATRRVGLAVSGLLAVAALALMTLYLDPGAVWTNLQQADLAVVAAAGVLYALSWPVRGVRYRDILAELGYDGDWRFLTGAVFVSQTGNLVVPARLGDGVRAYVMKTRRRVPYPSGFASLAVERVFDLLTITALAGGVLVGLAVASPDSLADLATAVGGGGSAGESTAAGRWAVTVAGAVGALAVLAVAVIVATARAEGGYLRRAIEAVSDDSYVEYVADVVGQFAADVQAVAGDGRAFARVGATSLLIWVVDVLTAAVVLFAFGVDLPAGVLLAACFFAVSVGNLAKVLPLSPGGIGLYEGAFTLLMVALTPLPGALALSAALVDHAVKNVVTVLGGVVSMLVLNVSLTEAVEAGREAEADTDAESDVAAPVED